MVATSAAAVTGIAYKDVVATITPATQETAASSKVTKLVDIYGETMADIVTVTDENGNPYTLHEEEQDILRFPEQESGLQRLRVSAVNYLNYISIDFIVDDHHLYFTNQVEDTGMDSGYYFVNCYGRLEKLDSTAIGTSRLLDGREKLISGRGYIWSRTIPLLREYLFLGSGQDTFAIVYPNNDYIGKLNWDYENILITKPHCMYLQIAVQSGVLSLLESLLIW